MKDGKGFSNQIIKGTFWIAGLEVSNQLLQFVKTFYIATILSPSDFGIVGFAMLVISFLDVLSTTGMKEAIIQRKDDLQSYLSTVWLIEIGKGITVLVLSFALAPVFINVFKPANPLLSEGVIRLIGGLYFLQCSTNIGVIYFEKNIEFKKFFIYQFSGTVVDVFISLTLVYYLKNVWALFFGNLAGTFVRVVFSFILTEFRPTLHFSYDKAKELFLYGKWIFRGRIFTFIGMQLDSIIVSAFFGIYALGIYQMGFRIGSLPILQVSNIMGKVVFPSLSKVQDDPVKIKSYFLTAVNILSILIIPIVILIFCFIPEFTMLFLGAKWMEIVPIVRILILSGFMRIIATLLDYFFSAVGEPKVSAALQFNRSVVFILAAIPLAYFAGIFGVALSGLIALTYVTVLYLYKASIKLKLSLHELNKDFFQPIIFGLLIAILLMLIKTLFVENTLLNFFLFIISGGTCYIGAGLILNQYTNIKFFQKTISIIKSYKH